MWMPQIYELELELELVSVCDVTQHSANERSRWEAASLLPLFAMVRGREQTPWVGLRLG